MEDAEGLSEDLKHSKSWRARQARHVCILRVRLFDSSRKRSRRFRRCTLHDLEVMWWVLALHAIVRDANGELARLVVDVLLVEEERIRALRFDLRCQGLFDIRR